MAGRTDQTLGMKEHRPTIGVARRVDFRSVAWLHHAVSQSLYSTARRLWSRRAANVMVASVCGWLKSRKRMESQDVGSVG